MGAEVPFNALIAPGRHRITIEVVPNGFNHFGPHHYYLGDHRVVSPAQIAGNKNFADPVDAPIRTHVDARNFRRWELPAHLVLLP